MTEKTPEMEAAVLSEAAVDAIPEGEEEAVTSKAPAPVKKLDLRAFVAGIKPVRRSARLYGNGGARIDLDVIDRQINEAKARGMLKHVTRLQKERVVAVHALNSQHIIDLTIVGWTERRADSFAKELTAAGVTDPLERNLRQAAAQIIEIDGVSLADGGVTPDDVYIMLCDLYEIPGMSSQVSRLVRIIAETNADPAVVSVPL